MHPFLKLSAAVYLGVINPTKKNLSQVHQSSCVLKYFILFDIHWLLFPFFTKKKPLLQMSELGQEIKAFGEGAERQRNDQYHLITPRLWHLFSFPFSILFFPLLNIHSLKLQPPWKDTLLSDFLLFCIQKAIMALTPPIPPTNMLCS